MCLTCACENHEASFLGVGPILPQLQQYQGRTSWGLEIIISTANLYDRRRIFLHEVENRDMDSLRVCVYGQLRTGSRAAGTFAHHLSTSEST